MDMWQSRIMIFFPTQFYDAMWQSSFNQIMTIGTKLKPPTRLGALC
jgi:hypothetical protein